MSTTGPNPIFSPWVTSGQGYYGPFFYNGNLFCVLRNAANIAEAFSKPVGGTTWASHGGTPSGFSGPSPGDTYFDGQKIWYLAGATSGYALFYFDCVTLGWTAAGAGGVNFWTLQRNAVAGLSSGNALVFGTDAVPKNIGFVKVTSGSWGGFNVLHTEALTLGSIQQSGVAGVAVNQATGTTHVIYCDGVAGSGIILYYRKILASGAISAEQTIATAAQGEIGMIGGTSEDSGTTMALYGNRLFIAQSVKGSGTSSAWVSSPVDDTTTNPASWTLIPAFTIPNDTDSQSMLGTQFGKSKVLRVLVDYGLPGSPGGCVDGFNNNYFIERDVPNDDLYLYSHAYKYDVSSNIVGDQLWSCHWNGTGFDPGVLALDFLGLLPAGACPDWSGNLAVFASVEYSETDTGPAGPSVTCGSPPSGKVGTAYSHDFPATGGTAPYVFSITTGTLPPGLLLTTGSGNVSGIPTLAGDFPITVTVTDAASLTGTANCSIHIDLTLDCNNPPNGSVGAVYSHPMLISGATPPYTFTITAGGLPPGLSIGSAGIIFGTPTAAGIYGFTVSVLDHIGNAGSVACSINVLIGLSCNSLPGGKLGDAYLHSLTVAGAPPGSTLAITSGSLPPGLTLDDTGQISGTPILAGTFPFVVTVTPPTHRSTRTGTIALPGAGLGWDYRQCPNAPIPGALGGYEYSGNQYLFLFQGSEFSVGDFKLHALKSTDLGVTWTDTGSISIPNNAGTGQGLPTYTSCMDGSTVYVMGVDLVGVNETTAQPNTGPLLLYKYDLTTNTFGAGSTPGGAPTVTKGWNGTNYPPRSGVCLHLLRRGAGDMLLLYTGIETISTNKWARIYVATFNGSSCGSGLMLGGQAGAAVPYTERCACFDASGNLHVILASNDSHLWYHVAMSSAGSFGTFQTIETDVFFVNDTSNLLDFAGTTDTIAFLGVRNRSSSSDNGDLAIYSAPGGSLSPTWTFHNLPSTANPVQDPRIAPDWIGGLGFLNGTLYAFWTQTGVPPSWSLSSGMGEIRGSTASATDLTTWTAETSVMGPLDAGEAHWGAMQVAVWQGLTIGLGVLGNFEGYDDAGTGDPIETSQLLTVPPSGGGGPIVVGPNSVACSITIGYGTLQTSCGVPPVYTVNVPGGIYRPPPVLGAIGLPPIYDLNGTLVWTFPPPALPPGFHWDLDPISPTYGYMVGTPTQSGSFDMTYTVSTPDGQSVTNTCPITVNPGPAGGGPSSTASCSVTITPQPDTGGPGGTPCPDDTIGGPG